MPYTKRPFEYYGTATNQVLEDLNEANDNFEALAKCFVDDDPLTQKAKDSDKTDGYHASKTPAPNTIPVAKDDGKIDAGWIPVIGIGLPSGQLQSVTFTSSTNWVVPQGVTKLQIIATGGGGGGGGACGYESGRAGEGGYCGFTDISIVNVTPGETLTITIGAGGSGGYGDNNGGNGGTTSVSGSISGTLISVSGGIGGRGSFYYGGMGYPGQPSMWGRGGKGGRDGNGEAGQGRGAGGGGAGDPWWSVYTGGAGASGIVKIIYLL